MQFFIILMYKGIPLLWIDTGFGAVLQYKRLPRIIYITHNHADHAAELPVILSSKGKSSQVTLMAAVCIR